jgi:hypothetical protein
MNSPLRPDCVLGLPGVGTAARFEGAVRNRRGPTRQPASGKDRWYKAGAESQRSREGIRGVYSTSEVPETVMEGRNPALVRLEMRASARA